MSSTANMFLAHCVSMRSINETLKHTQTQYKLLIYIYFFSKPVVVQVLYFILKTRDPEVA